MSRLRRITKPILEWYDSRYKVLLIVPLALLLLAFIQLGVQTATTGTFVQQGITLTGGVSITVAEPLSITPLAAEQQLASQFEADVIVRTLTSQGTVSGIIVESNLEEEADRLALQQAVEDLYDVPLDSNAISVEATGSSLGEQFFVQTMFAILIAYIFMGIMVFLAFRSLVPSALVILAAFANLIGTLSIFNILGFQLSSAGIAAFLMLIGYSVDTDILLTSRVLKHVEGKITTRLHDAMKTGLMMVFTTMVALLVAFFVADSAIIHEIVTIVLIGLVVDLINTWFLNASLLRLWVERVEAK